MNVIEAYNKKKFYDWEVLTFTIDKMKEALTRRKEEEIYSWFGLPSDSNATVQQIRRVR